MNKCFLLIVSFLLCFECVCSKELAIKKCIVEESIPSLVPQGKVFGGYWAIEDFDENGLIDYMVIVRDTTLATYIVDGEVVRDTIERNPRGYMLVMDKGTHFEATAYNDTCFASENEDGGVYFAPELHIEYWGGVLDVQYWHGRYGSYGWKFRYKDGDFVLISKYKDESSSIITETTYSENIDYEKGVKKARTLKNEDDFMNWNESEVYPEPVYETTVSEIENDEMKFMKMSEGKWQ